MILRIVNRGLTWEMYERVAAQIDLDHVHPLGLIMHGAIKSQDGAIQVAQVWESEEYAQRFDESLAPALRAAGVSLTADITTFELHHLVTP